MCAALIKVRITSAELCVGATTKNEAKFLGEELEGLYLAPLEAVYHIQQRERQLQRCLQGRLTLPLWRKRTQVGLPQHDPRMHGPKGGCPSVPYPGGVPKMRDPCEDLVASRS